MSAKKCFLNIDLAKIYPTPSGKTKPLAYIGRGDFVNVVETTTKFIKTASWTYKPDAAGSPVPQPTDGYIRLARGLKAAEVVRPIGELDVLKVNFIDVQQGDGCVIETPSGKVILVDGGDNQMFARYLAARYRKTTAAKPKRIDCIIVTHGDADHFSGLTEIHDSETHATPHKRLFIHPKRIFHNGLVKRPGTIAGKSTPDKDMFGATVKVGKDTLITALEEDLREFDPAEMNRPFRAWRKAIDTWTARYADTEMKRIESGMHDAFDFLAEDGIGVEVLGPIPQDHQGSSTLKFLGTPNKEIGTGHNPYELHEEKFKSLDASHTINGHSIVLKLTFGGFSFLLTGDLNDQAERILTRAHNRGDINLTSDILKTPHHGSADFSAAFLQAVAPVISVVSSGDESPEKEYIHPRATLIGSLGKHSRLAEPVILVTEMVAFFKLMGNSVTTPAKPGVAPERFFGFSRAAYGIVKIRTNGSRLLVYTNSGKDDLKEAYAFEIDEMGLPQPANVIAL
jgi:beta-lactamase superfamily II metal-dependent hydrolase